MSGSGEYSVSAPEGYVKATTNSAHNLPAAENLLDRGSQYASGDFQNLLEKYSAIYSMSRKGNCGYNAPAESMFAVLKRSLVFHNQYEIRAQARQSIFEYIERFYNRKRIHSSLGYRTLTR